MAYTASDISSAVQDDLGDPSFSSARILRYISRAQSLIFNTLRLRFTEKVVEGTLTVGEYTYAQQTDHQSTIGGSLTDPDNSNTIFLLDKESWMESRAFFDAYPNPENNDQGMPRYWTEYGDQVYFNCPVDKEYVFKQRYYRVPTPITAGANVPEVPETFRELIEYYCLYRAEKYRGNHDVAATYKQDFEDGLESMVIRYSGTSVAPVEMLHTRARVHA